MIFSRSFPMFMLCLRRCLDGNGAGNDSLRISRMFLVPTPVTHLFPGSGKLSKKSGLCRSILTSAKAHSPQLRDNRNDDWDDPEHKKRRKHTHA